MPVAEEVRYVLSEKLPNIVSFMPVEDITTVSFLVISHFCGALYDKLNYLPFSSFSTCHL